MRCPKCGYFSFDDQETCTKCHKQIADLIAELNGTMHTAIAPLFLRIPDNPEAAMLEDEGGGEDQDLFAEMDDLEIVAAEPAEEEPRELVVHFDEPEEVAPDDSLLALSPAADSDPIPEIPPLDFGALDISDLAPPIKETDEDPVAALSDESLLAAADLPDMPDLPDAHPVLEPVLHMDARVSGSGKTDSTLPGLEDLNIEGLNLEVPAKLGKGGAPDRQHTPSVKTGTALDQFNIDLGSLFPEEKK